MKKIILFIAALTIALQGLWAQTPVTTPPPAQATPAPAPAPKVEDNPKFNFGIEVSPAITWLGIKNDQIESDGSNVKLNFGLNFDYNFTRTIALATGLHFNTFGGKLTGTPNTGGTENITYELTEVEVPIGLKLRTPEVIKDFHFTAHMGLGFGIDFNGRATRDDAPSGENYENDSFDYTIMPFRGLYNLGIGAEYNLRGMIITGKLNYKGTLTRSYFYSDSMSDASHTLNLKNPDIDPKPYNESIKFSPNAFEICLGVLF